MPILSHGGTINAIGNHPNAYMYCATAVRADSAVGEYGQHCVEIHDVVSFFTAATLAVGLFSAKTATP